MLHTPSITDDDVTTEIDTIVTDTVTLDNSISPLNLTETIFIVVGGIVAISLLLICCVVIVCLKRSQSQKNKRKKPKARRMTKQEDMIG